MTSAHGEWAHIGRGTYQKYNPTLRIRTTVFSEPAGVSGKVNLRVVHEQYTGDIIELNKKQQNEFRGFRNDLMTQTSRIPLVHWQDWMKKCGQDKTGQYDEKKFKSLINDPDHRYFKTVNARL